MTYGESIVLGHSSILGRDTLLEYSGCFSVSLLCFINSVCFIVFVFIFLTELVLNQSFLSQDKSLANIWGFDHFSFHRNGGSQKIRSCKSIITSLSNILQKVNMFRTITVVIMFTCHYAMYLILK